MTQPYPADQPGSTDPTAPDQDRWPHQRQPGDPPAPAPPPDSAPPPPPPPPPPPYPPQPGYPAPPGYPAEPGYPPQPGYPGQPGYPTQPGYAGQPGYPTEAGYPPQFGYPAQPGYPPPEPGLNGFAVASLVLGIIGGILLSVIFGIIALVQMRKRPYRGKGLAIAGLVLSGVWLAGLITLIAVAIATDAERNASGQVTEGGSVSALELRPGDCVNDLKEGDDVLSLPAVPCGEPHEGEVFANFQMSGTNWPGEAQVSTQAEQGCWDRLSSYAPKVDDDSVELFLLQPTQESWTSGDHGVTCIATTSGGRATGSIRD